MQGQARCAVGDPAAGEGVLTARDAVLDEALAAARQGAPAGLRRVYELLAPGVTAYLRRRAVLDPEDLAQEVFLAVLPRLRALEGGGDALRAFAYSVAHRRAVDDGRRRVRRPDPLPLEPERDGGAGPSAEVTALERLGEQRVRALLALLSEGQRDVLLLRVVGDLTVEQTAQALGRTPGAVKQLQRRGLLVLQQHLAEGGEAGA